MDAPASPSSPPAAPPPPPAGPRLGRAAGASAIGVAALALLGKAKGLLVLLKGLKFGKLLLTMGSMVAMIAFEAQRYGWLFGVGFVVLILIHELGHGFAIRRAGLQAGYPVFIPFFGAFISLQGQIRSPLVEAEIALAGPIAGAAASAACAALYLGTGNRLLLALAYSGFFLNLFNMTPISPLDGGRAAKVFSRNSWIVGLVVLGALFLFTSAPQLLIIGLLALTHAFRRAPDEPAVEVPPAARRNVAAHYFGLCIFLAVGAFLTRQMLGHG
jgi:Zn-dependent protease